MWETIKETLNGSNASIVLGFIFMLILIAVLLVKGNKLRISTPHLKIGEDEQERAILRQQIEWSYQYVNGLYGVLLEMYPKFDKFKTKYILELVYDEIVNWISFNHITRSEMYIMVKQEKIRSLVLAEDVDKAIRSKDFKPLMNEWTSIVINRLVDIREYYKKKES